MGIFQPESCKATACVSVHWLNPVIRCCCKRPSLVRQNGRRQLKFDQWLLLASGLPGGDRSTSGPFNNIGNNGNWWSSTESSVSNAWYRNLNYNNDNVNRNNNDKRFGFSVHCVRDLMENRASPRPRRGSLILSDMQLSLFHKRNEQPDLVENYFRPIMIVGKRREIQ